MLGDPPHKNWGVMFIVSTHFIGILVVGCA